MRIARGTKKTAPRQGCKLSVTTTATNNHEHLAPLTGCGCDATHFYTPATPDGAAGNPSRMARDKPAASLAPAAVQVAASMRIHGAPVASSFRATVSVAASVNLHGASPGHRSKLLTQSPKPVASQVDLSTLLVTAARRISNVAQTNSSSATSTAPSSMSCITPP